MEKYFIKLVSSESRNVWYLSELNNEGEVIITGDINDSLKFDSKQECEKYIKQNKLQKYKFKIEKESEE